MRTCYAGDFFDSRAETYWIILGENLPIFALIEASA